MNIKLATTKKELVDCYPVFFELRPHLTLESFLSLVERMQNHYNYQVAYLDDNGIKAVAGIRIAEWLYTGKYLEIEDLVTTAEERSKNYGGKLFDWIKVYAKENDCIQLRLVSGVQRERAHQFYINKEMKWEAKYFSMFL